MKTTDIKCREDSDLFADIAAAESVLAVAVKYAEEHGLTICVETVPQQPLAMGNVKHVYSVRPNLATARAKMERDKKRAANGGRS